MENGLQEPIKTKEILIFHVFFDNLFFDRISDTYDSLPYVKNLYYYYPLYSPKFEKIKNTSKIKLLQNEKDYLNYLKDPQIDVILFHSLNSFFYKFFKFIDKKKLVIWWAWGYDMYNTTYSFRPLIHIPNMVKHITSQYMMMRHQKGLQNPNKSIHQNNKFCKENISLLCSEECSIKNRLVLFSIRNRV